MGIPHLAGLPDGLTFSPYRTRSNQVVSPRCPDLTGLTQMPGGQRDQQLDSREHHRLGNHSDRVPSPVYRQKGADPMATKKPLGSGPGNAIGQLLTVADHSSWGHHDPRPHCASPPAQVDMLVTERHLRVEAADCPKKVAAHQHASSGHRKHLLDNIVLFLIEFAVLNRGNRDPGLVHQKADLENAAGVVPVHILWTDNPRVGPHRLMGQQSQGVWRQRHIIVAEHEEVGRRVGVHQHSIDRWAVSGI